MSESAATPPRSPAELERRLELLELHLRRERNAHSSTQHKLKRQRIEEQHFEQQEEEGWLTVYLDMLTLLLVMLVIMLAFAGKQALREADSAPSPAAPLVQQSPAMLEDIPPAKDNDLLQGLDTRGLGKDVEIIVNAESVSLRVSSEILFAPGQADLSVEGLAVLQPLLGMLRHSPHRISVAGHTDSIPIHNLRYPSNWELSAARAGSVVRYLQANGIASSRLQAIGMADTQPLADNQQAAGRAQNRRVELILEKPLESAD
ncbi:OmpA/MotB family protein [Pseudomonas fluvialis]|uniref:OmpA/MotB family protein n=1 Tax=Pseudomonas fluvialis TaxID=1793966 RepID=UPI00370B5DD2